MHVTTVDWIIVAVFFVMALGIALYMNSLCTRVADYLVAARKVRMWLGIGAGIGAEIGLVSVAAMCEQGYLRGYSFTLLQILSIAIMVPLFGVAGFGIERFRATGCMSVPEYLERRYSRGVRIISGTLNCFAGVIQMSIFPVVGAMFLVVLIGAPETFLLGGFHVRTVLLITAILLGCNVLFTYLGGAITLTVTNFFMMVIIMGAICTVSLYLVAGMGLQGYWSNLERTLGLGGFYPFTGDDQSYGFIFFAWSTLMGILLQFSYGPYLQKYASMDRPKTVSRSYLLGVIFGSGRLFLVMGLGVVTLSALGTQQPADFSLTNAGWSQMATPYFLGRHLPPLLMGFLLACLLFADITSTDQYLLSWSTSIVNDCILPWRKKKTDETQHIVMVRWTIIVLCVLFFFAAIVYRPTMPIWEFLWLCANIIGGSGIAVLAGMYWRRANTAGAYAAIAINVVLPLADQVTRYLLPVGKKLPVTPQETGLYSYVLGMVALVVVSLATRDEKKFWDLKATVRELNRSAPEAAPGA
jgi:SSS family solute:Na+ symporter